MSDLKFNNIVRDNIFTSDFEDMKQNNIINFSKNIVTIYAPNGTGKTTTVRMLSGEDIGVIECIYNNKEYNNKNISDIFHVIYDQNSRNIIAGDTQEFFLGDNIREEKELKKSIDSIHAEIFKEYKSILKKDFSIRKKSPLLFNYITTEIITNKWKKIIAAHANNRSTYKDINLEDIINLEFHNNISQIEDKDETKMNFIIKELLDKDEGEILKLVLNNFEIEKYTPKVYTEVRTFQKTSSAIEILTKFCDDENCIVCDTHIDDVQSLLLNKQNENDSILRLLDGNIKKIIDWDEKIKYDPFNIKEIVLKAIQSKCYGNVISLKEELSEYIDYICLHVQKSFKDIIDATEIREKYEKHKNLVKQKIELSDSDQLYIQAVLIDSLGKDNFLIEREDNQNIVIKIKDKEFLDIDRKELPLSTGEQNFLSICFELLKAKNTVEKIIVIDDPISSFDSIYKNKLIYSIIKILKNRKVLIFTHTLDTLRLLEHQFENCAENYILYNIENGNNGFILINNSEFPMLIELNKLIGFFKKIKIEEISDIDRFLISVIPFMRGYSNIVGNNNIYKKLSKVMHGYETEKIDVAIIYNELFDNNIKESYTIGVSDIIDIGKNTDLCDIIKSSNYPLLNQTLCHNLLYLYLRLLIEQKLVEKFNLNTSKNLSLGKIIEKSYKDNSIETQANRIALMSKKTLLNEFNHFEGNLSIFQPAMDISNEVLRKEKEDIEQLFDNNSNKNY